MIENKMAAEIIGDLGYDERLCQKLCSWLDMTRERKTTESDEIETDDANDHNALRKAAMEALLKMGTKSRIGATKVFAVALKSMEDPLLCDTIVAGLTRMVSAHAELVDAVRSAWTEAGDGLQNTMLGKATKLPLMLAENAQLESEALLIDMVAKAEHQIARQALIGLERRVRSIGCLSDAGREICRSLRPEFIERICLCAAIRSSIARDSGRHDMAIDSLSYRLRELFEQYTQLVWLTYRTPENAVRFDRDMRHIHSEDILTRDLAVKSLEITFESSRNLYLEISDLVDATDVNIEKSEQDRLLGELATRRHYSWVGKGLTASVQRLFELKVDEWIAWSLTPQEPKGRQREGVVASTALENLNVALNVLSDERLLGGIPSELLARLILQGRHFTKRRGERLLYEGLKNQGIAIVFDGESSLVTGNQLTESFPSPSVWGVSATLSKQCLREGVRAGSPKVEGIRIDQRSTDAWLVSHPHATRQICRKLIGVIEELNIRESTVSKERGDLKGTLELLGSTVEYLRQIVPALQLTKERTQRRFLISSVALETKEPGSRLESKILEQYYLIVDEEKELRLRCEDDRICTMTLRDKSRGEVTISVGRTLYDEMMPYRLGRVIRKTRYKYLDEPLQTWSIDVYDDGSPFRGMVIAELDLPGYQEELPETPVFVEVLSDISDLSDFENRNLALHGPPDLLFVSRWGAK
jgi:CYTH domain-containing protein